MHQLAPELTLAVSTNVNEELQHDFPSACLEGAVVNMSRSSRSFGVDTPDVQPSNSTALHLLIALHAISKAVDAALLLACTVKSDGWLMHSHRERQMRQRLQWLSFGCSSNSKL